MKTVPDKCPFCESPIIIHGGNPLRSEDGGFATYECKTSQDAKWDNDQFIRVGQSDVCRFREVIMLKKQRDEANERIKRLESFINRFLDPEDLGYAVNNYVRDDAREALGRERVESGDGKEKL